MTASNDKPDNGFEFITKLGFELSNGNFDIPSFPDNALRIKSALADPEISADAVSKLVATDPVISARLLKVANSVAVNGAGAIVTDVRMAVARMGFKQAYNTVVSIAVEQTVHSMSVEQLRPQLKILWQHSVTVAAYSYVIAKRQSRCDPDMAMLAGLLHDIGKIYLLIRATKFPELFADSETLENIISDWHTGIGKGIIDAWHVGDKIAQAADEHEVIERKHVGPADLVDIVIIANLLAHQDANENELAIDYDSIPAAMVLKLSNDTIRTILEDSQEDIQSIIQVFEV